MLGTRASLKWLHGAKYQGCQNDDLVFSDKDSATLYLEGVLSDTHMLALIYCGEMCGWLLKTELLTYEQDIGTQNKKYPIKEELLLTKSQDHLSNLILNLDDSKYDFKGDYCVKDSYEDIDDNVGVYLIVGKLCLQKFISIAEGPLSVGGWNIS